MPAPKLALQLYTLRELMKDPAQAPSVIERVGRIGYLGVEPAISMA